MARNASMIPVPPEQVFAVLADPFRYHEWVVGAKEVRGVDGDWPEPGSVFHHSLGMGPLTLQDNTECLEVDAPRRIVLEARARPLGRARIEIRLVAVPEGTRVTMDEVVVSPPLMKLAGPLMDPLMHLRNVEALRRLGAAAGAPAPKV
ncbi:MAG: SRPBCC family protein [Acidimicrobiales bacterium]